jgi:5-formyltetrahydrofolate cyclo-ligase
LFLKGESVLVLPPLPPIAPGFASKEILRLRMGAARKEAARERPDAAKHAARLFMDHAPLPEGATVSLYHPMKNELDTKPLAEALLERGFKVALPVTPKKRGRLTFRAFRDGDPLSPDRYGIMTPTEAAPEVRPVLIVTPLLAFTRDGARLGYGGGYYDRTLAALRAEGDVLAVGYAYAAQEVAHIPMTRRDERLDWIITEREAIDARGWKKAWS